ncbi:MAG: hypothetical protein K0Q92_627 [Steroidobacteraceae bacterium]|jgi:hypothetical protein|nr:hypothetical protein [Steroidobacteraceae bacterium]
MENATPPRKRGRPPGQPRTGGRQKGTPNKLSTQLKETILQALHEEGGVTYLRRQANENPATFMSLIGKVLPMTVQHSGDGGGPIVIVTGISTDTDPDGDQAD